MSIINDALKKVQSSLSNNPEKPVIAPPENLSSGSNGASEFSGMSAAPAPTQTPAPETPSSNIPAAAAKTTVTKAKETKMVYILGALCLLTALFAPIVNHKSVFGLIIDSIPQIKKSAPRPVAVSRPQQPAEPSISSAIAQKAASIKEELTQSFTNMNNTVSPSAPASSSGSSYRSGRKIILSGVLAQGDKNVALIDGQVYEAGETVDNVKILTINPNSIVVDDNGLERTIKVGQL